MTPQEALTLVNQTLRQVSTTADNHDLLREAVQTLARVVTELSQDGASEKDIPEPVEEATS